MLISVILVTRYTTSKWYTASVLLMIAVSWLGLTAMSASFFLKELDLTGGKLVEAGRGFEQALLTFPCLALLALLFRRLWAAGLWIALCLVTAVDIPLDVSNYE